MSTYVNFSFRSILQSALLKMFFLIASVCFSQTKEQYQQDLKIYKEIIETSHTGIYLYTPKAAFDALFKDAKAQISTDKITSARDFFLLLAQIHTKINCGHSSIFPSSKLFENIEKDQNAFFPLKVKYIKDTLIVAKDYKSLKKGTQLLKINNQSVAAIKKEAFKLISSDGFNTTHKYHQLEERFAEVYFILYGAKERFDLEVLPYGEGQLQQRTLEAVSPITAAESIEEPFEEATEFELIDEKTALLTVNTFSTETAKNQKKFFKFLKRTFKTIKKQNIKNLIVDVRENTGGDDGNDMELASYLINKPFKENKFRKLNTNELPIYPEYLHPQWIEMMDVPKNKVLGQIPEMLKEEINKHFHLGEDGFYYKDEKHIIKRAPNNYLFSGTTYVLIGGKVFSGGSLFSALVRDKSAAIFVGEETGGGYYRHTGSIPLIYELPNSLIPFSISIVINEQDVDQQLVPQGSGTRPHFEVYPTIKDYVNDRDTVLEFVKGQLKK